VKQHQSNRSGCIVDVLLYYVDFSCFTIMYFAACQKIVKPRLKLATGTQAPFARQSSVPVSRANALQTQLAHNKTVLVNGDIGVNSASAVSLTPTASGPLIPPVSWVIYLHSFSQYLRQEILWSHEFVGWLFGMSFVCYVHCNFSKTTSLIFVKFGI